MFNESGMRFEQAQEYDPYFIILINSPIHGQNPQRLFTVILVGVRRLYANTCVLHIQGSAPAPEVVCK